VGLSSDKKTNTLTEVEFEIERLQSIIKSKKVNHILHLLLCVPTFGLWVIIWILISITASSEKSGYEVELKEVYEMKGKLQKKNEDEKISQQINNNKGLDVTEKLIKLSEMLEKGLITEDEFKSQKKAIL